MQILKLVGKKWAVEIIENLERFNISSFTQLKMNIKNISNRVLSERLSELEKLKLITRKIKSDRGVEYTLSQKGLKLKKILEKIKRLDGQL